METKAPRCGGRWGAGPGEPGVWLRAAGPARAGAARRRAEAAQLPRLQTRVQTRAQPWRRSVCAIVTRNNMVSQLPSPPALGFPPQLPRSRRRGAQRARLPAAPCPPLPAGGAARRESQPVPVPPGQEEAAPPPQKSPWCVFVKTQRARPPRAADPTRRARPPGSAVGRGSRSSPRPGLAQPPSSPAFPVQPSPSKAPGVDTHTHAHSHTHTHTHSHAHAPPRPHAPGVTAAPPGPPP